MATRHNLNLLLGGLLTIGIADLIWLNGWIAPAVFGTKNNEAGAQIAVAPSDDQTSRTGAIPEPVQVLPKPLSAESPVQTKELQEPELDEPKLQKPVDEPELQEPVDEPELDEPELQKPLDEPESAEPVDEPELPPEPVEPTVNSRVISSQDMNVLFNTAATVITPFYKKKLRRLAQQLGQTQSGNAGHLRILGHADARGTDDFNDDLALRRAKAVQKFLQYHGVNSKFMTTETFGERRPIANAALHEQRRVEIRLIEGG